MSSIRIALLCNNKMALPALQRMQNEQVLCSIATADKDHEIVLLYKEKAKEYNVPYYKISYKSYKEQLQQWLEETKPDIVFVMTFPWKIPLSVFSIPKIGMLNFHYGLLPEMRGADPVFESIRQRKSIAGTTVHIVNEELDEGPIVMRQEIPLSSDHTYGMLCSQMAHLGESMTGQIIQKIKENIDIVAVPQEEDKAVYWPRIGREQLEVRWQEMDSLTIKALVRSCNPITKGIRINVNNWNIGLIDVTEVNIDGDTSSIVPGTIIALDLQNGLLVCCKDGKALKLEVIYTEEGILPGYKIGYFGITPGMIFS
jgi:methionyl-tRNA formyltransferase